MERLASQTKTAALKVADSEFEAAHQPLAALLELGLCASLGREGPRPVPDPRLVQAQVDAALESLDARVQPSQLVRAHDNKGKKQIPEANYAGNAYGKCDHRATFSQMSFHPSTQRRDYYFGSLQQWRQETCAVHA